MNTFVPVFLASANKQVVALSEELACKVEDSLRQQEEISSLLGQVVDLQQRCKAVRMAVLNILHLLVYIGSYDNIDSH